MAENSQQQPEVGARPPRAVAPSLPRVPPLDATGSAPAVERPVRYPALCGVGNCRTKLTDIKHALGHVNRKHPATKVQLNRMGLTRCRLTCKQAYITGEAHEGCTRLLPGPRPPGGVAAGDGQPENVVGEPRNPTAFEAALPRMDTVTWEQATRVYPTRDIPFGRSLCRDLAQEWRWVTDMWEEAAQEGEEARAGRLFKLWALAPAVLLSARRDTATRSLLRDLGDDPALWIKKAIGVVTRDRNGVRVYHSRRTPLQRRQRAVQRQLKAGQVSKAYNRAVSQETVMDVDEEVRQHIESKLNVEGDGPKLSDIPAEVQHEFREQVQNITLKEVVKALHGLSKGSSPGVTSYTPEFLQVLVHRRLPHCAQAVRRSVQRILLGQIPEEVLPFFGGGSLTALRKNDGTPRPIVPQGAWCKLSERVLINSLEGLGNKFSPVQFAVGVKAGNDLVVNSLRGLLEAHPDHVAVALDVANAYSSVSREQVLQALLADEDLRWLAPWVKQCYDQVLQISVRTGTGWDTIPANMGILQGSVLGPLLYATLTAPMLRGIGEVVGPGVTAVSILDDIFLVGPAREIQNTIPYVEQGLERLNQVLKPAKCEAIYGHALNNHQLPPGAALPPTLLFDGGRFEIPISSGPDAGLRVLGVPLGGDGFVNRFLYEVQKSLLLELVRLQDSVTQTQSLYKLLELCFPGKLNHLQRLIPQGNLTQPLLDTMDGAVLEVIATMTRVPDLSFTADVRLQVSLARAMGGLGVGNFASNRTGAMLGSFTQTLRQQQLLPASVQELLASPPDIPFFKVVEGEAAMFAHRYHAVQMLGLDLPTSLAELKVLAARTDAELKQPQAFFNRHVNLVKLQDLETALNNAPDNATKWARMALLRSSRLPGARLVFDALPVDRSLTMANDDFRTWMQRLLHLPLTGLVPPELQGKRCCWNRRGKSNPLEPYHISVCKANNAAVVDRHDALVQGVVKVARDVGIGCRVEERELGQRGLSGPDVYLTIGGTDFALDVTTAVVEQSQNLRQAADTDLFRALEKEKTKRDKYGAELALRGRRLLTLCYESTGAMGTEFLAFWSFLSSHISDYQAEPTWPRTWVTRSYVSYAKQYLAVMHASQTCRMLRQRVQNRMREYVGTPGWP